MNHLQERARAAAKEAESAATLLIQLAVHLDRAEEENREWRDWCTKVAHASGFCEGIEDIGKSAADAARHGSNAIRRSILGRLHERNAERNAALAKLEPT